jgi:hypothetical protein
MKKQLAQWARSARMLRWIPSAVIAVAVAGLFSFAAPSAKADTWDFSLTNPGNTTNIDFSFPGGSPSTSFGNYFQMNSPVDWTLNNVDQGTVGLQFWNFSQGGGLVLGNPGSSIVNLYGPQLYSGSESSPTFLTGTYSFNSNFSQFNGPFTLTVADPPGDSDIVATPEPSSVLLLATGLLGLLGLAAYRSQRSSLPTPD